MFNRSSGSTRLPKEFVLTHALVSEETSYTRLSMLFLCIFIELFSVRGREQGDQSSQRPGVYPMVNKRTNTRS